MLRWDKIRTWSGPLEETWINWHVGHSTEEGKQAWNDSSNMFQKWTLIRIPLARSEMIFFESFTCNFFFFYLQDEK